MSQYWSFFHHPRSLYGQMTILSSKCSIPSLVNPQTPKKDNFPRKNFFLAYPSKIDLLRQTIIFWIFGRFLAKNSSPKKKRGVSRKKRGGSKRGGVKKFFIAMRGGQKKYPGGEGGSKILSFWKKLFPP